MKWLLIPALFASLCLQAQTTTTKLSKMTVLEGSFITKFDIGDKTVSRKDAALYLQKNQNSTGEAYSIFKKANQQNTATWLWFGTMCIGGALAIYGSATDGVTSSPALTGIGFTVLGGTVALITSIGASKNYKKSVDTYNRFAGY